MLRCVLLIISVLFSHSLFAQGSLVVLLYHHVASDTPRSTSLSLDELKSHIDWLKSHHFIIKPLDVALNELKQGRYSNRDYIASISFDDSYKSICNTAWPYLKQQNIPFTVFINSGPVERHFGDQCSIEQLQEMAASGLVIIGNHTQSHAHLADSAAFDNQQAWLAFVEHEITTTQQFIEQHFGKQPLFLSYPYGEYNLAIEALAKQLGYIAFGQQSGAIGKTSNWQALPRFALAGRFADLKGIPDKLNSLAFPASEYSSSDNPINFSSSSNPPLLTLTLSHALKQPVQCFLSDGSPIAIEQNQLNLKIQADKPLKLGRERYSCTSLSPVAGRYYWFSHQWIIRK